MALGWFRRNQKFFLAVLTAFLMVTWGLGTYWSYLFTPTPTVGQVFGTRVTEPELKAFTERWRSAFFVSGREPKDLRTALWPQLAMVKEAERAGLDVSPAEVDARVRRTLLMWSQGRPFSEELYAAFLRSQKISKEDFEQAIRERLLIEKLQGLIADQANISNTQVWERYSHDNEKTKVRYIAFKPEYFIPAVTVTEDDIRKFYADHENDIADPANGKPGYRLKDAVQAEVLFANYSDLEKLVKVSDDDVKKFYEENKETYFKIEPKPEQTKKVEPKKEEANKEAPKKEETQKPESKKTGEKAAPAGDAEKDAKKADPPASDAKKDDKKAAPPAKPEGPKDQRPAEAKPAAESPKPAEQAKTPPAPEFKPFAEVKDEIRHMLMARESSDAAKELIEKANNIISPQLLERVDFSKVYKDLAKEGLTYTKTDFFAKDDGTVAPAIPGFAKEAFGHKEWEPSTTLQSQQGWYIFQVIARRPSESQALNVVRDQVIKDLKTDRAMKKAKELAERCQKIANEKGLEAALAAAQKELPKLPEPKPAAPEPKTKGKEKAAPPKAQAPETLKIQESDYFTRPTSPGQNPYSPFPTGWGTQRPNVAREAFQLQGKAAGVAVEEAGERACYLLQVADRKPADAQEFKKDFKKFRQQYLEEEQMAVLKVWMEDLKKSIRLQKPTSRGTPIPDED